MSVTLGISWGCSWKAGRARLWRNRDFLLGVRDEQPLKIRETREQGTLQKGGVKERKRVQIRENEGLGQKLKK